MDTRPDTLSKLPVHKMQHTVYYAAGSEIKILGKFDTWLEAYEFFSKQPDRSKLYMGTI